jgi:hypothetical protein
VRHGRAATALSGIGWAGLGIPYLLFGSDPSLAALLLCAVMVMLPWALALPGGPLEPEEEPEEEPWRDLRAVYWQPDREAEEAARLDTLRGQVYRTSARFPDADAYL